MIAELFTRCNWIPVAPGDWIVLRDDGEYDRYPDEHFQARFEPADPHPAGRVWLAYEPCGCPIAFLAGDRAATVPQALYALFPDADERASAVADGVTVGQADRYMYEQRIWPASFKGHQCPGREGETLWGNASNLDSSGSRPETTRTPPAPTGGS